MEKNRQSEVFRLRHPKAVIYLVKTPENNTHRLGLLAIHSPSHARPRVIRSEGLRVPLCPCLVPTLGLTRRREADGLGSSQCGVLDASTRVLTGPELSVESAKEPGEKS
jgi:hypothetical protein